MKIRNKKTGEIKEVSVNELNQYGLGGNIYKSGGEMIKRADGSYSRRGLWDNIRANAGSDKKPTKEMLNQERKIRNQYQDGGEEDVYWRTKKPMVNDPSMDAISKVLLQRNQDKNFMQRAAGFGNQNGIPTRYIIDGEDPDSNNMSNLLMGFGDNYVSPTIIETFPNFLGNNSTMLRTAPGQLSYQPKQKQEYIKAPTEDIADYFAAKGYKRAANDMYGMKYKNGGEEEINNLKNVNLNLPVYRKPEMNPLSFNKFLVNDKNQNLFIGGINPRYQNENFSVGPYMVGVGNKYFQKFPADMGMSGTYHVNDNFDINMGVGQNNVNAGIKYKFNNGGDVDMYGMQYQTGGNVPTIDGPSGYMNEDDVWIVDNETIKRQAQELGSKRVLTEGGSLIIFDDNWNIVAADDNPDAPYKQGGSVTLNTGGENHRIYVKTTNRGEGKKGNIMVNHPTMDKGMWDTIDLTKKSGATTIAQGVAATKKWHRENPYIKEYVGDVPMYAYGVLTKYQNRGEVKFNPYENANRVSSNDGTKVFRLNANQLENAKKEQAIRASVEQKFLNNIKIKAAEERKRLAAKKLLPSELRNMGQIMRQENYIKRAEGPKAKQPYAIVDKIGNVIRYYDVNHNMVKEENVITGESNKDVDKELSWDEFMRVHPTADKNAYIDYLQATNNKTTPSGLFKLHYKNNLLENPSTKGKIADMIIPGHRQKTIDARSHTYGNSGKMFTFISQYGIPSSKAIHGTGYEDRLAAFTNGTDRNLSNGCINVNGKTICFDFLKENSNLYILPEEQGANNIVTFKPALSSNSGRIDPTRNISRERVNEIRQTKKNFNNINKAANLGMNDRELNFATSVAEKESKGGRSIGSKMESNLLPGTIASSYGKFEMKEGFPWLKGGNPNNDTVALKAVRDFYREKNSDNFEHSDNFSDENFNNEDINNARMYTEYNTGKSNPDAIWGEDYLKNLYPLTRYNSGGGIPERYRNMGFTNVGAKKQSTRPGKKWMVLAKKGDDYKVVHGGYKGMQDFKQHHSEQRKENFWSRMGGRNSSKATDPFSPLYWHKRFGTWEYGGQPMAVGGQNVMNPIVKKDNRNWLEYLKN